MTQGKIEGKFYPLQHDEWLRACRELTPAELKCLYYIRTSDPYSNGVRLTAAAIARDLSCEGQPPVSRQTVSRAIKRLDQLGYIEMEPLEFNVKISGKGVLVSQHTNGVSAHHDRSLHTNGVLTHHDRSSDTADDHYTPPTIATHQQEPETVTQQEFCNPKTSLDSSKTNKDLNKTLSESAGERKKKLYQFLESLIEPERTFFLDFCNHAAANAYTNKIALPELWIASHFEELHRQYWVEVSKKSRNSPAVENQQITVEDLQRMYGANWKAAAAHFGIEVEEEIW
jgi:DNA-binding MarR family transcriptional regulator